ncbi:HlyD family efflux transporter periplasmic adaptor subunit [Marinomonas fungiae]|uniref:Biotin-lipoyl like/HlyD family secretion protein n=1 Tax=Marinomonas fungiae TaxID=1137284 RepID=A0A0K6IGX9_9GAMM|nr:HlyD family efflux transporter periplasmic adaptor subunit [Marinomonas fungiae]CUB02328.1 Biotin-lipoyl like/HlyD family secretion protein [Marinomonas fungiae]
MSSQKTQSGPNLHSLLNLQQEVLSVTQREELYFKIVNDSLKLVQYDQAVLFTHNRLGKPIIRAISGLVTPVENTPFSQWLTRINQQFSEHAPTSSMINADQVTANEQASWAEWWLAYSAVVPLKFNQQTVGTLYLNREEPFSSHELKSLDLIASHYAYAVHTLQSRIRQTKPLSAYRKQWLIAAVFSIGLLCLPIQLRVSVPAQVMSQQEQVVASPLDGVIAEIVIEPNSYVQQGDLLFRLDDSVLRNEYNVALQNLAVTQVEARTVEQRAFRDSQSKADLAQMKAKIEEKQAEIQLLSEQLARTDVHANFDGFAIFNDKNDWLGIPVKTGERVMTLAASEPLGIRGWIPVQDAVALENGSQVTLYLTSRPESSFAGELTSQSFQTSLSPNGLASYQFEANLVEQSPLTIGASGTAILYGEQVSLAYFIFRRPLGFIRQWLGI